MSIAAQLEANLRARVEANLAAVSTDLRFRIQQHTPQGATLQLQESVAVDDFVADTDSHYSSKAHVDAPYARYVIDGTGVYGPAGTYIVPRQAKALAFVWPKAGWNLVFFKRVAGSPPNDFFYPYIEDDYRASLEGVWGHA